jgi:hypothetical protein
MANNTRCSGKIISRYYILVAMHRLSTGSGWFLGDITVFLVGAVIKIDFNIAIISNKPLDHLKNNF